VTSRRAVGSNQYCTRAGDDLGTAGCRLDLVAQAGELVWMRCGDMWGTDCRAWVQGPGWRHARHGYARRDRRAAAWRPSCPPDLLLQLNTDHDEVLQAAVARH